MAELISCEICGVIQDSSRDTVIYRGDGIFYENICHSCHIHLAHRTPNVLNSIVHSSNKMKAFSEGKPMKYVNNVKDSHEESIIKRLENI